MNKEFSTHDLKLASTDEKRKVDSDGNTKTKWVAKLKGEHVTVKVTASSKDELDDLLGGTHLGKSVEVTIGTNQTSLSDHAE